MSVSKKYDSISCNNIFIEEANGYGVYINPSELSLNEDNMRLYFLKPADRFGKVSWVKHELLFEDLVNVEVDDASNGDIIYKEGNKWKSKPLIIPPSTTPSGVNNTIQINNNGKFNGKSEFSYNPEEQKLSTPNIVSDDIISGNIESKTMKVDVLTVDKLNYDFNLDNVNNFEIPDDLDVKTIKTNEIETRNIRVKQEVETRNLLSINSTISNLKVLKKLKCDNIETNNIKIDNFNINEGTINNINSRNVIVSGTLETNNIKINNFNVNEGTINDFNSKNIKSNTLEIKTITSNNVISNNVIINKKLTTPLVLSDNITSNKASIKELSSDNINAKESQIKSLSVDKFNMDKIEIPEVECERITMGSTKMITRLEDFPEPIDNVITLEKNVDYIIMSNINLKQNRINIIHDTTICGFDDDISGLKTIDKENPLFNVTNSSLTLSRMNISGSNLINAETTKRGRTISIKHSTITSKTLGLIKGYESCSFYGVLFKGVKNALSLEEIGRLLVTVCETNGNKPILELEDVRSVDIMNNISPEVR